MGRTKGSKNKGTGQRFKDFEGRFPKDKHLRLTRDMMLDKSFLSLSGNAIKLYLFMKLWASGQDEIDYSASMSTKLMSKPTYFKARDELIAAGFIEFTNRHTARDKKQTSHFEFSTKWQGEVIAKPFFNFPSNSSNSSCISNLIVPTFNSTIEDTVANK